MSDDNKTKIELDRSQLKSVKSALSQEHDIEEEWVADTSDPTVELEDSAQSADSGQTNIRIKTGPLEQKIREKMREPSSAHVKVDPLIGQVVGDRFQIQSKIGAGGMGIVYKARQKGMDRHVAIKVLLREYLNNDTAIRRFQREALAVSKLEHPNTVRIYDFGDTDDGQLYIAMEFLRGTPLDKLLAVEGQLAVRRVLRIVQQVCRSLDEAHAKGIVHRDLKPDNIFAGNVEGQEDFTKVLDFGLAKLRATGDEAGTLTQHGTVFGTPKYMSPEQCRSQEVDPKTDLYSLGIIMFELLTGSTPFVADNPLAILIMHAQDPVPALSAVRPNLVIPFEVEELMHRLLAKEPNDRPAHAKAVIEDCERLLHAVPNEFETVLTYQDVEEQGMDFNRSQAYTVPENATGKGLQALGTMVVTDRVADPTLMQQDLPPVHVPLWVRLSRGFAFAMLTLGIAAGVLWSNLESLSAQSRQLFPSLWARAQLPTLAEDTVLLTLRANVGDVAVRDAATNVLLGQIESPEKPLKLNVIKETKRNVELRFSRAGATPIERTVTLDRDQVIEVNDLPGDGVVEKVQLSVTSNVTKAQIEIDGMEHVYLTSEQPDKARRIPVPKGTNPLKITVSKAGYETLSVQFVPSSDGAITAQLTALPDAGETTVTITVNVSGVSVHEKQTNRSYKTGKAGQALPITLKTSETPVIINFAKKGYKSHEKSVLVDGPKTISIKLDRRKGRPGRPGKPATVIDNNRIRISPIKRVKRSSPKSLKIDRMK